MRCREAQRKLAELNGLTTQSGMIDNDLKEHLLSCDICAKQALALKLLKNGLASALKDKPETTPFPFIKSRLQAQIEEKRKEKSIMSTIKTRPKLTISLSMAVLAFLIMTLVPFKYSKTVGYNVVFSKTDTQLLNDDSQYLKAQNQYLTALNMLGHTNISMNRSYDQNETEISINGLSSYEAAVEAAAAFNKITGNSTRADYVPIIKEVSGTLYAQALEKYFQAEISVDANNKTDEEIAAEVAAKLKAMGIDNPQVKVTTEEVDGQKQINIQMESDQ